MKRDAAKREKQRKELEAVQEKVFAKALKVGGWQPITSCPFEALGALMAGSYDRILVTDGTKVTVASVSERFGTPIEYEEPPTMVMRDGMMIMECGKIKATKRPKWWLAWELKDELESDDERYGKPEVDFEATHWMPLPPPPHDGPVT